jgi:hypothetical protein
MGIDYETGSRQARSHGADIYKLDTGQIANFAIDSVRITPGQECHVVGLLEEWLART